MRYICLFTLLVGWCPLLVSAQTTQPGEAIDVVNASRVTLELKGVAPKAAFAQLAGQSGMLLRPYPPNLWESREWGTVDLSLKDVSFWTAVRELCDKTGLSLQRIGMERDLYLMQGGNRAFGGYPTSEHGPFLVVAQSLERIHQVDLTRGREPERRCDLRFVLYAEPRITIVKGDSRITIIEGVDENGRKLTPSAAVAVSSAQAVRTWMWAMSAGLTLPEGAGQKIASLKGAVRLQVQTRSLRVEFDDVLTQKDVVRTVAGRKVVFKEAKKAGTETYTVQIEVHRDPGKPAEWNDIDLYSTFRMEDAEGKSLTRRNPGGRGAGGSGVMNIVLTFGRESWAGGAGEPAKLVWDMPLETGEIEVPFEFSDLPMP